MRQLIKTHLVNRSNRPVNRSNRPVYHSKPVTHVILNLDLNSNWSNRPVNRSNRPVYRYEPVELRHLNLNLNLTGFYRSNRSGLPEPECSGLELPVGKKNPDLYHSNWHRMANKRLREITVVAKGFTLPGSCNGGRGYNPILTVRVVFLGEHSDPIWFSSAWYCN